MENQTKPKMSAKMKKHVKKLEAQLEASKESFAEQKVKSVLDAANMDPYVMPHLYQSSIEILKKKVPAIKDRHYEVKYMGIRGPTADLPAAGKRLAELINNVCGAFQIVGVLGTTLKLDLAPSSEQMISGQPLESVFLVYLAFSPEAAKVVDKLTSLDAKSVFFNFGTAPKLEVENDDQ